jgi:hypothetical protein
MFRGEAEQLLSHCVKCFEPAIDAIVEAPQEIWSLDVDAYADGVDVIPDVRDVLRGALPGGRSDTLVSTVMLGCAAVCRRSTGTSRTESGSTD